MSLFILIGCNNSSDVEIHSVCQQDEVGNYQIKWETIPELEGTVKIYVSTDPDSFSLERPVKEVNIKDGVMTYIADNDNARRYFMLVINNRYKQITATRSIAMDSVQNLHDIGGYFSDNGKMTRWGKIYRSGSLGHISRNDMKRLDSMKIRTIISLQTKEELARNPIRYNKARIIHIPIPMGHIENVPKLIKSERMLRGDVSVYLEDCYLQFVANDCTQWNRMLSKLQDKDIYPVLISCSEGKDRSGFASALILSMLDIPKETVLSDYMASNENIDILRYETDVDTMSTEVQEAVTVLLTANQNLMSICLQKITKDYGSIENYLKGPLKMNEKQQHHLRSVMLSDYH